MINKPDLLRPHLIDYELIALLKQACLILLQIDNAPTSITEDHNEEYDIVFNWPSLIRLKTVLLLYLCALCFKRWPV